LEDKHKISIVYTTKVFYLPGLGVFVNFLLSLLAPFILLCLLPPFRLMLVFWRWSL